MECETESTETMIIFWNLLNEVLEAYLQEQKDTNTIPKDGLSTSMVENGRQVEQFMEFAVNEKTVFKQSVVHHTKNLKNLKTQQKFKTLADKLMTSATPKFYDEVYNEIREFIENKPKKQGFLSL
ncbi:Hypothetical predicted protein [Paramuricea clavata]|uniref:Uncharacterized protein n=1 Tax=Paramuricea clavata TaxID=317549 RepID=A0A7D9H9M2_PARCT|nr:Hypothetical predicted protein [Paramuricea clavata]